MFFFNLAFAHCWAPFLMQHWLVWWSCWCETKVGLICTGGPRWWLQFTPQQNQLTLTSLVKPQGSAGRDKRCCLSGEAGHTSLSPRAHRSVKLIPFSCTYFTTMHLLHLLSTCFSTSPPTAALCAIALPLGMLRDLSACLLTPNTASTTAFHTDSEKNHLQFRNSWGTTDLT